MRFSATTFFLFIKLICPCLYSLRNPKPTATIWVQTIVRNLNDIPSIQERTNDIRQSPRLSPVPAEYFRNYYPAPDKSVVKTVILVLTGAPKQDERMNNILSTWGSYSFTSDVMVHYLSETVSNYHPIVAMSDIPDVSCENNVERFFLGLLWVLKEYPSIQWLYKVVDDTAIVPQNFQRLLSQLHSTDHVIGRCESI